MTPWMHDVGPCALHFTNASNTLAAFVRNGWPDCSGMGGRIRPECLAGFNRNRWPNSIGMGGGFSRNTHAASFAAKEYREGHSGGQAESQ